MAERSQEIFGNEMSQSVVRKAERSKENYIKKFGDDSNVDYQAFTEDNPYIGPIMGVRNLRVEAPTDEAAKAATAETVATTEGKAPAAETVKPDTAEKAATEETAPDGTIVKYGSVSYSASDYSTSRTYAVIPVGDQCVEIKIDLEDYNNNPLNATEDDIAFYASIVRIVE